MIDVFCVHANVQDPKRWVIGMPLCSIKQIPAVLLMLFKANKSSRVFEVPL